MKNQEIKAFVNENAEFILLLRGDEKKLISRHEFYEKLIPFSVEENDYWYLLSDPNDKPSVAILFKSTCMYDDLVRVAQRFAHILWTETQTA